MVMQHQAVKQQLQEHGQLQQAQQQQQQQPASQRQLAQGQQAAASLEGVPDVVVEEAAHAGQIADAFQQSACCVALLPLCFWSPAVCLQQSASVLLAATSWLVPSL